MFSCNPPACAASLHSQVQQIAPWIMSVTLATPPNIHDKAHNLNLEWKIGKLVLIMMLLQAANIFTLLLLKAMSACSMTLFNSIKHIVQAEEYIFYPPQNYQKKTSGREEGVVIPLCPFSKLQTSVRAPELEFHLDTALKRNPSFLRQWNSC